MNNEQEHTDRTLEYYNNNASAFTADTQNVDFSDFQKNFLQYIPEGGRILDLGCGAGRDSKAFIDAGYKVDAVDGSAELCRIAESYIGQPVTCARFQDFEPEGMYNGIWACASLLHLSPEEIHAVLTKMAEHLYPSGCMYVSFKYGDFSGYMNGRFFQNMTEKSFGQIIQSIPNLYVAETKTTSDVRPGRESEMWLNQIIRLKMHKDSSRLICQAIEVAFEKHRFTLREAYEEENGDIRYTGKVISAIKDKDSNYEIYNATSEIYQTIVALCENISISFSFIYDGIARLHVEHPDWNPCNEPAANEKLTYYFIENVVYRTSVLWDLLAQLYNVYWGLNKKTTSIHAKIFFEECNEKDDLKGESNPIYSYFEEPDDSNSWTGHFKFVKSYRNQLAHRLSPSINAFSKTFCMQIRQHPLSIACRVAEDYLKAIGFINEALDKLDVVIREKLDIVPYNSKMP